MADVSQTQRTLDLLREEWTARYREIIEQFLAETVDYEEMFVSELRDRVGDFRTVAADAISRTQNATEDS